MISSGLFVIFGFLNFLTFTTGDTEISCQFGTDCILPCSFNTGDEVVIHWILKPGDIQVHSFYYNKDQLDRQNQRYKGRTSLDPEQFSRGNASLRLKDVGVQDEGRYQCYTSTVKGNKETYIQLQVYAPIQEVTIRKLDNNLTCSSDGIYPEPNLIWTIGSQYDPPEKPRISRTESELYSISSSIPYNLKAPHNAATCSISTTKDQKKATLTENAQRNSSFTEATVECQHLDALPDQIVWRFNHNDLILTQSRVKGLNPTAEWQKYVKEVSPQGDLTLKDLTSKQEGTYTCESSNAKETATASTPLRLVEDGVTSGIVIAVIAVIVIIATIAVAAFVYACKKKSYKRASQTEPQ
ncbi:PREDICTED: V-set domain-containing T-cell activation inhibitor 1-like [Poecilia mexicana]|uniref:Ig-like domain-containing protein n=1 Tax=Poecilia mexicana TaxID=48701 RepID=A0A3B3WEC4_9TELE|nr:PREDICTED: V-set domain-containing T-cell activation inhibitor 1-like [Poecilia mexicana]